MKATSILILGSLLGSAAAFPAQKDAFGGLGGNRGSKGRFGGKGVAGASSVAVAASSAAASASSVAVSASAVSSAPPAASSAPPNNNAAVNSTADPQSSTTLLASVIGSFDDNGQNPPVSGQSPSLTSTNNYINFCALTLPQVPLTNGAQITTGSCNPAPIGVIPSTENMPSAKFNFPKNGATIAANTAFNAELNVANFQTGVFTNAQLTYFAAPQALNGQGQIIGHTHIVIEALTDLQQTTPNDPTKFIFFKGVDDPAVSGVATAAVTAGVPAGFYRMCSINTSANHVPIIGPIAQHGSFDDCSYFTAQ